MPIPLDQIFATCPDPDGGNFSAFYFGFEPPNPPYIRFETRLSDGTERYDTRIGDVSVLAARGTLVAGESYVWGVGVGFDDIWGGCGPFEWIWRDAKGNPTSSLPQEDK